MQSRPTRRAPFRQRKLARRLDSPWCRRYSRRSPRPRHPEIRRGPPCTKSSLLRMSPSPAGMYPRRRRQRSREASGPKAPSGLERRSGASGFGCEGHRNAVHAIAQPTWSRSVIEHVTEVTSAAASMHFGSNHQEAAILGGSDCPIQRRPEAWPSRAAFKLGLRGKQRQAAGGALKRSLAVFVHQGAAASPLRPVLAQDMVRGGRELFAPLLFRLFYFVMGRRLSVSHRKYPP